MIWEHLGNGQPGAESGGLSKARCGGNNWLVLLKFCRKIWQEKSNGQVAEREDAKIMWAEGNKGGQSCWLLMARLFGTKDLAGFQNNSSQVPSPELITPLTNAWDI